MDWVRYNYQGNLSRTSTFRPKAFRNLVPRLFPLKRSGKSLGTRLGTWSKLCLYFSGSCISFNPQLVRVYSPWWFLGVLYMTGWRAIAYWLVFPHQLKSRIREHIASTPCQLNRSQGKCLQPEWLSKDQSHLSVPLDTEHRQRHPYHVVREST